MSLKPGDDVALQPQEPAKVRHANMRWHCKPAGDSHVNGFRGSEPQHACELFGV